VIKREALQRIKRAFEAAGIKFAYPTVTVNASNVASPLPDGALEAAARVAIQAPANEGQTPA
jgi:hypothetical protein